MLTLAWWKAKHGSAWCCLQMQKELEMRLITILLFAATAAVTQTMEPRMPVT